MKTKLSERKQRILRAVVDEYIRAASPISSGEIQSKYFPEISSATIRSELSTLEDMGFLIQPHTSAGRVPAPVAYKLYAENFLPKRTLTTGEVALIHSSFEGRFRDVEDIVKTTARVISDLTNYTSVVVLDDSRAVRLREIKLVDLDERSVLIIIVTDSGVIKDKVITTARPLNPSYLKDAAALLNNVFYGKTVDELKSHEQVLSVQLKDYKDLFDGIVEILVNNDATADKGVIFEGAGKFLEHPDQDIDTARSFLRLMDGRDSMKALIDDDTEIEFSVKVGKDEDGTGLDKCAVVTAKYSVNGLALGHAGVIGPARMDYCKVVSVLDEVRDALRIISDNHIIGSHSYRNYDETEE